MAVPVGLWREGRAFGDDRCGLNGGIHRACFEQWSPVEQIVRTPALSRGTVYRVIRTQTTEFKYQRGVQPDPEPVSGSRFGPRFWTEKPTCHGVSVVRRNVSVAMATLVYITVKGVGYTVGRLPLMPSVRVPVDREH
jgi:hypothetical protein